VTKSRCKCWQCRTPRCRFQLLTTTSVFFLIVSLAWSATILHSVNPVSSTSNGSSQLTSHWRRKKHHKHLYMLLLAVTCMAVTVYLLVSVVNCWTGSKSSRMLLLILSQKIVDQSIWHLSYEIFIGCRFPQTRTNYDDCSFIVQRPWAWHSLPYEVWAEYISFETFMHKLKASLFIAWLST